METFVLWLSEDADFSSMSTLFELNHKKHSPDHGLIVYNPKSLVKRNIVVSPKMCKIVLLFPKILSIISSLQMFCIPTICFKIRIIKFKICCRNFMISQPLPKCKTQFFQEDEVCSYDNNCSEPAKF